jgi:hypothetical protein
MNALSASRPADTQARVERRRTVPRGVLLALCIAAPSAVRAEATIALREEGPRVVAELVAGGCSASLSLEGDAAAASFRDTCTDGLAASATRLGALFDALAERDPRLRRLQNLDCGRLASLPPPASERLARAAQADAGWQQALRARAAGGEAWANRWVAGAVPERGVLQEHVDLLRSRGLAVRGAGVEKVLVGQVGTPPAPAALAGEGIATGAELPWDAIVWLRLAPVAP